MEEAARFDHLVAMFAGKVVGTGTPAELQARTGTRSLEEAFIALLPEEMRQGHKELVVPPRPPGDQEVIIESHDLTQRFGDFVAVDHVSMRIERGEIFGFLGANGCGKSTTMKMLCGLLPATDGQAWLFGESVDANDINIRRKIGYMSQAFSLYSELTVRQNLVLHARLFDVPEHEIPERVEETAARFGLDEIMEALPDSLPLGQRQRLQLAVALIHKPDLLILDEPTSGVDPVARDVFWEHLIELSRRDKVTIFITTHFINEAQRCDRISLMSSGKVLVVDTPAGVVARRHAKTLEEAFIGYLEDAQKAQGDAAAAASTENRNGNGRGSRGSPRPNQLRFSLSRMLACSHREAMELSRDPIRLTMAGLGSVILMIIMGYGISLDVEHLKYAVLDRDQTTVSRDYADQHRRCKPVLHRAAARDQLRGTRPADAVGGAQHGHRDSPRFRPRRRAQSECRASNRKHRWAVGPRRRRRTVQTGSDRCLDRRRHATACRNDPGLCAGHSPPLDAGGIPASPRNAPATWHRPAPTGYASQYRVAVPL